MLTECFLICFPKFLLHPTSKGRSTGSRDAKAAVEIRSSGQTLFSDPVVKLCSLPLYFVAAFPAPTTFHVKFLVFKEQQMPIVPKGR